MASAAESLADRRDDGRERSPRLAVVRRDHGDDIAYVLLGGDSVPTQGERHAKGSGQPALLPESV